MTRNDGASDAQRDRTPPPDSVDRGADDAECYVLGGGRVGEVLARRLATDGHPVAVVDDSYGARDLPGWRGDPADVRVLADAGLSDASTVVVSTRTDRRNLLIAQLVSAHFDVPRILVVANDPDRFDVLEAAGHEPVCVTTALSDTLAGEL